MELANIVQWNGEDGGVGGIAEDLPGHFFHCRGIFNVCLPVCSSHSSSCVCVWVCEREREREKERESNDE